MVNQQQYSNQVRLLMVFAFGFSDLSGQCKIYAINFLYNLIVTFKLSEMLYD